MGHRSGVMGIAVMRTLSNAVLYFERVRDARTISVPRITAIPFMLGLAVIVTRLPFLGHGYGDDPDAWRAVSAAQHLINTGQYLPSRGTGYPIPEFAYAAMLWVGLGSSWWLGLLTAIMSGVAAALVFQLFLPLGQTRAIAGALAFAFTPEVFVASVSAMDFMWGATFFLAATLCASHANRVWWVGVFLGLAVASRPTYAIAVIPLTLLYVEFDVRRLTQAATWRKLAPPMVLAAAIAAVFFVPAFLALGADMFNTAESGNWLQAPYEGSIGLLGVVGFVGVAAAVVSAVFRRRRLAISPGGLDGWAFTVIILWALLFIRLPHDASYLIPALIGVYALLCHYTHTAVLWAMTAALLVSCFVLRVDTATRSVRLAGPVLWNIQAQKDRSCVADAVRDQLASSPDNYVVAAYMKPQLDFQLGEQLAGRILQPIHPDQEGRLRDEQGVEFPAGARFWVVDRVVHKQQDVWKDENLPVLATCATK